MVCAQCWAATLLRCTHAAVLPLLTEQMLAQDRLDGGRAGAVVLHADAAAKAVPQLSFTQILAQAGQRALGGGLPGAGAMAVQVLSLMWLRTTMNWRLCKSNTIMMHNRCAEYRHGGTMFGTIKVGAWRMCDSTNDCCAAAVRAGRRAAVISLKSLSFHSCVQLLRWSRAGADPGPAVALRRHGSKLGHAGAARQLRVDQEHAHCFQDGMRINVCRAVAVWHQ